ncbi:hypothetical protein AIOL_001099 [Candidatus Rhodobacter oscarellae]|uniref:Uncharacterized protein n=1 Tax=Candidatus Rhodobacter oscarellae TaxID=1675527 RepID=A0A0J9E0I4_9RHOB|nr:class II D-tagatose-bisphosphate aldolase, non-catalytic subunit [Candidatus Rhodobacter lobularis]KMW56147.1 hypothetical protein AIOL_001099 [Candidatus Rhodobacter lobularis]
MSADKLTRLAALRVAGTPRGITSVFAATGVTDVLGRVVGLVAQPGVAFGNHNVVPFAPGRAQGLARVPEHHPNLVFEAHPRQPDDLRHSLPIRR